MAKTYDTYKDSGIAWIGEIPGEWRVDILSLHLYDHCLYNNNLKENNLLSLSYGRIIRKDINTKEGLLPSSFNRYNIIDTGDIVLRLTDLQNDKKSLRTGLCKERGIITSAYLTLRNRGNDDSSFLHYLLHTYDLCKVFYGMGNGVRQGMNYSDVRKIKIPCPPLSVQQSISSFLDTKCGEIDSLISIQEEMISELLAYKQSVITEAVTKGLDKKAKMKNSGVEWIGDIPEEWKAVPIKHLKANVENAFVDGPFGSNLKSQHFIDNGDVYVIESGFVTSGKFIYKPFKEISLEHFETIKRSECKAGDIIIAKIGAKYGMGAELPKLNKPSVVSGNSLKITLDNTKILNHIFVYLLITAKAEGGYRDLVQENAQPALSLGGLNNFKLPVPPLPVQQAIATYLDEKTSQIDSLIALKQSKIESLKEYKKSIIYEYVTGKKRV